MMRIDPAADLAEIVELVEPVRRGGVEHPAGFQFAVVRRHRKSVVVKTADGAELMLPPRLVRTVKPAPTPPPPRPTLQGIIACGLLTTAAELGATS